MLSSTFTQEDFYERDYLALGSEKFEETAQDVLKTSQEKLPDPKNKPTIIDPQLRLG
jgi:hypothetical protein